MAGTFFEATAIGRLGQTAETHYSQSGNLFVTFSVAVEKWVPNSEPETIWINTIAFGKLAETLANLMDNGGLQQGDQVHVQGFPVVDSYQKQDGEFVAKQKLEARVVNLLGSRNGGGDGANQQPRSNAGGGGRKLPPKRAPF